MDHSQFFSISMLIWKNTFLFFCTLLVINYKIALSALAFGVHDPGPMLASSGELFSAFLMVTVLAHSVCVVRLVLVRALRYFFPVFYCFNLLLTLAAWTRSIPTSFSIKLLKALLEFREKIVVVAFFRNRLFKSFSVIQLLKKVFLIKLKLFRDTWASRQVNLCLQELFNVNLWKRNFIFSKLCQKVRLVTMIFFSKRMLFFDPSKLFS